MINIFVSSTFTDLEEYRKAVCDIIRQLGAVDVAMEHLGARDERPKKECLSLVQTSDAFIGIYAHRYGTIPKGETISITEMEYNEAIRWGKRCLIYIVDDNVLWLLKFIDGGRNAELLALFKTRLLENHVCKSFTNKDQLSASVAADLAHYYQFTPELGERWRAEQKTAALKELKRAKSADKGSFKAKSPTNGQINLPSLSDNVLVGGSLDMLAVAISPNYADDNTIWAGTFDSNTVPAARPQVFRSTDGGHKWVVSKVALGAIGDKIVALHVSPNYATDKTIFVATQKPAGGPGTGVVYRSTDGGVTFSQLGIVKLAANEVITSMDVSPNYDGIGIIAVGVANINGAAYGSANTNVQVWGCNGALSWTPFGQVAANDVMAVKFSPNYPIDATLLMVSFAAADIGTGPKLHANVGGIWDMAIAATSIGATALLDYTSPLAAGGTVAAAIALPSDYNGSKATTRRAWIALVGQADLTGGITTPNNSGVYRITGAGATASIGVITPLGIGLLGSLDYSGTFGAGTLVAGRYGHAAGVSANIYGTTNPADDFTSVLWLGATRPPTGTFTAVASATTINNSIPVALDKNFATSKLAICGTMGTDSAFAVSTDGSASVWNETGLIDNAGLDLATVSAITRSPKFATDQTIFVLTDDASGGALNTSFWVSTNGGIFWNRAFAKTFGAAGSGFIALSAAFDKDNALFVGDAIGPGTGVTNIYYSTNKGTSFSARSIPAAIGMSGGISGMAATDANTLYVAESVGGNVAKTLNAGWTWPPANVKATGSTGNLTSLVANGISVLVADDAGSVFRSDDAGVTWAKV